MPDGYVRGSFLEINMGGPYNKLTRGLNLMGYTASVDMKPGEALICNDVIFRHDGSVAKHWGWRRCNLAAVAGRPLAIKSFSYKGKNNNTAANPARAGNFGIADDAGGIFTRRDALYTTAILLTETNCYWWDPALAGNNWTNVALPGGVNIDPDPKPTIQIYNDNAYIVGWTDQNLRYDPVDRALYVWGWDNIPANAGHTGVGAGGTLVPGVYRYRAAWTDMYTGEQGELSVVYQAVTTAANATVTLDNWIAYAGNRHFVDAGNLTNNDVGLTVYRSGPDDEGSYYFLDLVPPGLAAAVLTDNGLATDYSLKADTRDWADPPLLNQFTEYKDMWYGMSWDENYARVYHNDFRQENSFWERVDPRDYVEIPLGQGEVLVAVTNAGRSMVALSTLDAYELRLSVSSNGRIITSMEPMKWGVGCVGPKAWYFVDGWLYFLSDRGPYRWKVGMGQPQWIGKNLLPMFIDPSSGLCQMTEGLRLESEACYDQDARVVRFAFPCGPTSVLNRHIGYWVDAEKYNGDPESGWITYSALPQCMDQGMALTTLVGGIPATPFDRRSRFIFAENNGYAYEYDQAYTRSGLPAGTPASGTIQAGSGVNLIVTTGGLFMIWDDMAGMRLEVVHTDGTIDITTVQANTLVNITPAAALSQDPTGGTWYVGGIPGQWRSWVDHMGTPGGHKDMSHLHLGYNLESGPPGYNLDVTVSVSGDWPATATRTRTAALTAHREKLLIARTGRFFTYEIANSRPDEPFLLTYIETTEKALKGRRT
jgi:hypothetical protein